MTVWYAGTIFNLCMSILYMFRAAMCPSSVELLYQCDTWFISLCVDDRLVCRYNFSCVFISIVYMFRAAMCPSSELLYQCDTWFMSLCVDDRLVCRSICYSLHVSGSHVPIIRRIIVSVRHLVNFTLCRWPSGMQECMLLHTRRSSTQSDINQVSHWYNNSPDDGHLAARNM